MVSSSALKVEDRRPGYVKAWRKTLDSQMYKHLTAEQRDVFWICLMLANHTGKEWEWGKEIFRCNPGQFITSLNILNELTAKNTTLKKIRIALDKLEKWGFLANKTAKTGRLITICNWSTYQCNASENGKHFGQQRAKTGQTEGKDRATTKNDIRMNKNNNSSEQPVVQELPAQLVSILGKYETLALIMTGDDNYQFWLKQFKVLAQYFNSDNTAMYRFFDKVMLCVDNWQLDNPSRMSRTDKGLRRRVTTWLNKEYGKLERGYS